MNSKSILISIKPEWVEKILDGSKTIEIRKSIPKCKLPIKVYIYCTKGQELWGDGTGNTWYGIAEDEDMERVFELTPTLTRLNGKVVAEFTLSEILTLWQNHKGSATARVVNVNEFTKQSCMTWGQYCEYHKCKNGKYPNSYAWYISNLIVYDEPKLLQEFFKPCDGCEKLGTDRCTNEISYCKAKTIIRPPQSWCYVQVFNEN